jgi:hypothetical protein
MSVLPAEVNAQLAQLLQQLQSADNNVRSQAEDVLQNQWTSQRPEWLLMGLAEQIGTSTSSPVRRSTPLSPAQAGILTLRSPVAVLRCGHLSPDSL